jgi:alkanesulfonate monooxygenase SsuD/methylene tetrahydromethanopterin reductase-like flavin-dependent oxidoreductase (luciferase family)
MTTHREHYPIRVGVLLWPQATAWESLREAVLLAESTGVDSAWTWDHLHAIVGDPRQPIFEGWTSLAAWAALTRRIALGLMVGANSLRNPGVTAKAAVTVDHASGGRAWLGLGGGWSELDHAAHGLDFGSGPGERLDWLDEAVAAISRLLAGETVTSRPEGHYAFRDLAHRPLPWRGAGRLPIMIGGQGERKTLRTVARYAQGWNASGPPELLRRKVDVLLEHCRGEGRDPLDIERTFYPLCVIRDEPAHAERTLAEAMAANGSALPPDAWRFTGPEERIAELWQPYLEMGFTHLIANLPAPHDRETIERLPRLRELVAGG